MNTPTDLSAIPEPDRPTERPDSDRPTFVDMIIGYNAGDALAFILSRVELLLGDPCRDENYRKTVEAFRSRLLLMKKSNAQLTVENILHYTEPFLACVNKLLEGMSVPFSKDVRQVCAQIELQVRTLKQSHLLKKA